MLGKFDYLEPECYRRQETKRPRRFLWPALTVAVMSILGALFAHWIAP
jgi:hypothetical protein